MPKEPKESKEIEEVEEITEEQAALDIKIELQEPAVESNQEVPDAVSEAPEVELNDEPVEVLEQTVMSPAQEADADATVTVQPVKFASFEEQARTQGEINRNLDILMDVKLQLTVELGRTELPIKKVLELTRGSIIELEKVAGEPVELYANGKLVAHGEVVVIEDNFGLRITSITEPEDRLKGV